MLTPSQVFAGASQAGPYAHGFIGAQILPFLTLVVRQTVGPENETVFTPLQPGVDVKLRLAQETRWTPEVAVGMQGAAGSGRLSPEYVVFSKRYEDLDFTAGVGWGRLGRGLGSGRLDAASAPPTWFTGKFGVFGGVEYFTGLPGLSIKLEYTPDRFTAERRDDPGFRRGLPLNAGVSYRPFSWLELGAGLERGDQIMLRAAVTTNLANLPVPEPSVEPKPALRPRPLHGATEQRILDDVHSQGIRAEQIDLEENRVTLLITPSDRQPLGQTVGRAARIIANRLDPAIEEIAIATSNHALEGVRVQLYRSDLERAQARTGSPEEIWRNASVSAATADPPARSTTFLPRVSVALTPRVELSFFEQERALVQRSSIILSAETERRSGVVAGTALRANVSDNLPDFQLREYLETGVPPFFPVRSDVQAFATQPFAIERAYTGLLWSPMPDWHTRLSAGHFEEMYAGLSGEVLYRPVGERWAAGLDVNHLFKRQPGTLTDLSGDQVLTGHASVYYEAPQHDLTTVLRVGRYLGRDWGATLELNYEFLNGIRLGAFATWTNGVIRLDGSRTGRFDQGLMLSVPLDGLPLVPRGSRGEVIMRPFGRDEGQRAEIPLRLYDVTEPISYRQLVRTWPRVMD